MHLIRSLIAMTLFATLWAPFACADDAPAPLRVVLMIGEDEYKAAETLPEFARSELEPKGMQITAIVEDPKAKNQFPGLVDALSKADLLVLFTRRRLPPKDQLDAVRAYLAAGKPLVGIRTACHPFAPQTGKKAEPMHEGQGSWVEFDPQVLGGHYTNHYPPGPIVTVTAAAGAEGSAIFKGVEIGQLVGNGSLYKVSPVDPSCVILLNGTIAGHPAEPVAWTHLYGPKKGRIFYTSLGHPEDFKAPAFRRLLLNGVMWAVGREDVR